MHFRSDKGMENVGITDYMISKRGVGRGSMMTGKSAHNQRVEGLWRDVYTGVLSFYYTLFNYMVNEEMLDPLNDCHVAALHYTFMPKSNGTLFGSDGWAGHRMRTVKSSCTLWMAGQFENPVGMSDTDFKLFGVDGIVRAGKVQNLCDVLSSHL